MLKCKIFVTLLLMIPVLSFSQKIKKEVYEVLRTCFKQTQTAKPFPFIVGTELLKYNHPLANFDDYLNTTVFQSEVAQDTVRRKGDSVFLETDIQWMKEQMKTNSSNCNLSNKELKKMGIASADSFSKAQFENPQPTIFRVSYPLFSKDRKTALVYLEYHCIGDCGAGDFYILKKKNNEWYLSVFINVWIS